MTVAAKGNRAALFSRGRLRGSHRRVRGRRRAMAMIWFLMTGFVTMGFVGSATIDYGQVLLARRQFEQIARDAAFGSLTFIDTTDAVAMAAAEGDSTLLDVEATRRQATRLVADAVSRLNGRGMVDRVEVSVVNPEPFWWRSTATAPTVRVEVAFRVDDLLLMNLFQATLADGERSLVSGTVTGVARVCLDGQNSETVNGQCVRNVGA